MSRAFIFQLIDGHFVSIRPKKDFTKKQVSFSHLSKAKQDAVTCINEKMNRTFHFKETCAGIAKQIAYEKNCTLPADTPETKLFKPDYDKACSAVTRFLTTGKISRTCFAQLKKALYLSDADIHAYHMEKEAERNHAKENAKGLAYFYHHIQFLIDHAEEIIACKEFYNVKLDDFGCSFAYSGRSAPVTLGELLQHYKVGNMTQPCPTCGGTSYVYFACGSPLSGANIYHAVCPKCRKYIRSHAKTVMLFFKPLMSIKHMYSYERSPYTMKQLVTILKRLPVSKRM